MKSLYTMLMLFFPIVSSWALERDNTANLGDKLDKNKVPAQQEMRIDELPNRPDSVDKNRIPAEAEERMREEEVQPVPIEKVNNSKDFPP